MINVWAIFSRSRAPSRLAYALIEDIKLGINDLMDGESGATDMKGRNRGG